MMNWIKFFWFKIKLGMVSSFYFLPSYASVGYKKSKGSPRIIRYKIQVGTFIRTKDIYNSACFENVEKIPLQLFKSWVLRDKKLRIGYVHLFLSKVGWIVFQSEPNSGALSETIIDTFSWLKPVKYIESAIAKMKLSELNN